MKPTLIHRLLLSVVLLLLSALPIMPTTLPAALGQPVFIAQATNEGQTTQDQTTQDQTTQNDGSKEKPSIWSSLCPHQHEKLHPPLVHFPIAFLILESALVLLYLFKPDPFLSRAARYLSILAMASFIPAVVAGLHDAGDGANFFAQVASGLADRISHFGYLGNRLSLHVLFVILTATITILRLLWQQIAKDKVFASVQRYPYAALTVLGLWFLLAAAQLGGEL